MALVYLDNLLITSVAARSLGSISSDIVPLQMIVQIILNIPGPYVTARSAYNKCPSSQRPSPKRVKEVFEEISGVLGSVVIVNNITPVFYKELPSKITDEDVREYNMKL